MYFLHREVKIMPWMIPTVLKNLFSGPATVKYPFEKKDPVPEMRGKLTWDMTNCDLCHDCERLCPVGAIVVDEEQKKITYDPFLCIYCRKCAENCFHKCIVVSVEYHEPNVKKGTLVFEKEEVPAEIT